MIEQSTSEQVKVWDPLVRIFHWCLVLFFFIAYITEEEFMSLHEFAGYAVGILIVFRLLWGFAGTKFARFSSFAFGPRTILAYSRSILKGQAKHYLGHNPLGAAMIFALLFSICFTVMSGMIILGGDGEGALAGTFLAGFGGEATEELHEFFANFTVLLVILHVAGGLFSSFIHKENLILSMITGYKKSTSQT